MVVLFLIAQSLLASGHFSHQLITFADRNGPRSYAQQNVDPDLDTNCLAPRSIFLRDFFQNCYFFFTKNQQKTKDGFEITLALQSFLCKITFTVFFILCLRESKNALRSWADPEGGGGLLVQTPWKITSSFMSPKIYWYRPLLRSDWTPRVQLLLKRGPCSPL